MYVYHSICLDSSLSLEIEAIVFVFNRISERKPNLGDILFRIESHWFLQAREYEIMQLKVKNSLELKRYVSQNISSNSWNSTVNKVGGLAKFVFSQALLYLFN